jgi:hypothetical protein
MDAADANVLTEEGYMLRTCEHGVRHPTGHLDEQTWAIAMRTDEESVKTLLKRHERRDGPGYIKAACCGCCPHRLAE